MVVEGTDSGVMRDVLNETPVAVHDECDESLAFLGCTMVERMFRIICWCRLELCFSHLATSSD